MRGKISEISMPGTFVLIGRNGPRTFEGASGFMSQVSRWDGPPTSIRRMQLVSRPLLARPGRPTSGRAAPAFRKSRLRIMAIALRLLLVVFVFFVPRHLNRFEFSFRRFRRIVAEAIQLGHPFVQVSEAHR